MTSLEFEVRERAAFLVEDEALIRMMTTQMVEELGHRAVEAGSIGEALPLAETAEFEPRRGKHCSCRDNHRASRLAVPFYYRIRACRPA
jgi:CheY-like chemotaxis protein